MQKQDDGTTSDNKEVVLEAEIIRQQKMIQQIQLRKKQILIHNQKLKKNQLHQVRNKQQNTLTTATTETKPQNIEKENVKPSTDKTAI